MNPKNVDFNKPKQVKSESLIEIQIIVRVTLIKFKGKD